MNFWLYLLFGINTIAIITALWLSWRVVNAGYLMNNKYYGDTDKQNDMKWIILWNLVYLVVLALSVAILNILFI